MSRPKAKDMRGLSVQELGQKRQSLEKELHDLRQKKVTGQLEKPHEFKAARRHIAQLNTILREKENADNRKK
jgi:large subunit ribosomal protein L29